jgi:hypothetical protein
VPEIRRYFLKTQNILSKSLLPTQIQQGGMIHMAGGQMHTKSSGVEGDGRNRPVSGRVGRVWMGGWEHQPG